MEYPMKLHTNKKLFGETVRAASEGSGINEIFVEKDYWITLVLSQLATSIYADKAVFKGGTSLSKGYGIIHRFSEDVDIALVSERHTEEQRTSSGNAVKNLLRAVEKSMTTGLTEVQVQGVSSKGSRFRKSVFEYPGLMTLNAGANSIIVEVNSFANPYPFQKLTIRSMVEEFLTDAGRQEFVAQYELQPFSLNVLDKTQTLLEKIVALIRSSFADNPVQSFGQKIRHFYDIYYLLNDRECADFLQTEAFKWQLHELLAHDKKMFEEPHGWQTSSVEESILLHDFETLWKQISRRYREELSALAFAPIPDERVVADRFLTIMKLI